VSFLQDLLQTLLAAPIDPVFLALILVGIGLLLVTLARGLVALLLRRFAPGWVEWVTIVIQLALLGGQMLLVAEWVAPRSDVIWQMILGLTLIAAAIVPGNLISDGVAFLRIRGLGYYRVGDWVTIDEEHTGRITAIHPLSTMIRTQERDRVRISNSKVIGMSIVLHRSQAATDNLPSIGTFAQKRRRRSEADGPRSDALPKISLTKRPSMGTASTKSLSQN
jgi:small-conductance mechanosensitive channel